MAIQLSDEQRFQALVSIAVPLLTRSLADNPINVAKQADEYLRALIQQASNPVPVNPAPPGP
jgi:hypothetical protein